VQAGLKTQNLFNKKFEGTVINRQKIGARYAENRNVSTKKYNNKFCNSRPVMPYAINMRTSDLI
jgi:hypothetical protein